MSILSNNTNYKAPCCEQMEIINSIAMLVGSNESFENSDWTGQGGWYESNQ